MSISVISDVHISSSNENLDVFNRFLANDNVKKSDSIFFLGDIFDLLVGSKAQYLTEYNSVFSQIKKLLEEGKNIYWFEGNHDFHTDILFKSLFGSFPNFHYKIGPFKYSRWGKEFLFCHGDEIEVDNPQYEKYKKIVCSNFFYKLANYIFPYHFIKMLGEFSSKKSRAHNISRYSSNEMNLIIRDKFRKSASLINQDLSHNYVICGHSHIKDEIKINDKFYYLNNGYAPSSQTFISICEDGHRFISI